MCIWRDTACVRLSDASVTSFLQLHHRRAQECLRCSSRAQRVTGSRTAGPEALPTPRHVETPGQRTPALRAEMETAKCPCGVTLTALRRWGGPVRLLTRGSSL